MSRGFSLVLETSGLLNSAIAAILIASFSPCFAEMPAAQANAIGAYLAASDLMAKLKASRCGYIFRKVVPTLESRIVEVRGTLKGDDLKEFDYYVATSEFKQKMSKNQEFIDGYLLNIKKDGIDDKTACGLLVGFVTPMSVKAERDWSESARQYR